MQMPAEQSEPLVAVNADHKWARRRRVTAALEAYRLRQDTRRKQRERYETLCAQLYSGRSSRLSGMPVNHDQFAAQEHFAEMLDEKLELEKALVAEEEDPVLLALAAMDIRDRRVIEEFYVGDEPKKATEYLCLAYALSSSQIYRIRDEAVDELARIMCSTE